MTLFRRERTLLLGIAAVLFFSAVMSVRQVLENQSRHSEMREAFILSHDRGHTADAQRLYDRLKYDMPDEPTRHLIDDLERTALLSPADQSASTNLLVRYHLSLKHEVEKRVEQRFLKKQKSGADSP
jgi:hypothetical protein